MTAESRTLEPESPIALRYFEARINRISYTIGGSWDPLGCYNGVLVRIRMPLEHYGNTFGIPKEIKSVLKYYF